MLQRINIVIVFFTVVIVGGCISTDTIHDTERDRGPSKPVDVSHISEPLPRLEPRTRAGNTSPYKVLGNTYYVNQQPEGYRAQGIASWYGVKFHGKRTANGEIYNMYGMTAAHRTLPIPSYVRVTNLKNKRNVIVRINDRGPYHANRIIDLTYTAAKKLGYVDVGTAEVLVEYIDPNTYQHEQQQFDISIISSNAGIEPLAPTPNNSAGYEIPENTYLQVGAFTIEKTAHQLRERISKLTEYPVIVKQPGSSRNSHTKFYRVRIGPLRDNFDLVTVRQKVIDANLPEPNVVYD